MDESRNERTVSPQILQYYDSSLSVLDIEVKNNEELDDHEFDAFSKREGLTMNLHELSIDSERSTNEESSNLNDDDALDNDIDEIDFTENESDAIENYFELYYCSNSLSFTNDEETDSDSSEDSFEYEFCEGMCSLYFQCTHLGHQKMSYLSLSYIHSDSSQLKHGKMFLLLHIMSILNSATQCSQMKMIQSVLRKENGGVHEINSLYDYVDCR